MILESIYKKLDEDENIIFNIIVALIIGFTIGFTNFFLWFMLPKGTELISALVFIVIIEATAYFLVIINSSEPDKYFLTSLIGLVIGSLVSYGVIYIFNLNIAVTIITLIVIFVLAEIMFLIMKDEKPKETLLLSILFKKLVCIFESFIIIISLMNLIYLFKLINWTNLINAFIKALPEIIKWAGYVVIGITGLALAVGIIILWLYLNSLKYNKKKRGK